MSTVTQTPAVAASGAPAPVKPAQKTNKKQGNPLLRYIITRLLLIIPTVLILVTLVFFLMRITGDPITVIFGDRLPPEELARRIHEAGYDRPLYVQYFEYLGQILTGNFGTTISTQQSVVQVLFTYGPATLELTVYALIVAFLIGIPLGRVAAYRRDKWQDAGLRVSAILAYATPIFFVGLLLKLVFSVWLGLLPVAGRASTRVQLQLQSLKNPTGINLIDSMRLGSYAVTDVLLHAILPAIALGLLTAGVFLRLVRTNMIGTLGSEYITAARSRGVKENRLISKHAWRPALIPIVTVIGMQIAMLLGGAVLTETTFEWKGLGFMLVQFITQRDFLAVQGIVALLAVIVAVTNFVVDIIAALVDPRVRF